MYISIIFQYTRTNIGLAISEINCPIAHNNSLVFEVSVSSEKQQKDSCILSTDIGIISAILDINETDRFFSLKLLLSLSSWLHIILCRESFTTKPVGMVIALRRPAILR